MLDLGEPRTIHSYSPYWLQIIQSKQLRTLSVTEIDSATNPFFKWILLPRLNCKQMFCTTARLDGAESQNNPFTFFPLTRDNLLEGISTHRLDRNRTSYLNEHLLTGIDHHISMTRTFTHRERSSYLNDYLPFINSDFWFQSSECGHFMKEEMVLRAAS